MDLPPPPNHHALAVLIFTVFALFLFRSERISLQSSCLFVLIALAVGFELFPYNASHGALRAVDLFSGFGHEALVSVCALMMASQGLVRTGALEPVGRGLAKIWRISPVLSLLLTMLAAAAMSAFMNNTPIVVLILPILINVCARTGYSASKILMPMGFATLLGGMTTTIGTSTNLLVVAVAADLGAERFDMFSFFLPGAIAGIFGILYLWLVAPHLLPKRPIQLEDTSPRIFSAQLKIPPDSFADGKMLSDLIKKTAGLTKVTGIRRGNISIMALPDTQIRAGDQLQVSETSDTLKEFERILGVTLYTGDNPVDAEHPLMAPDQQIAEIVVVQGSPLRGTTLQQSALLDRFQLAVLALHRAGRAVRGLRDNLNDIRLRVGDVLLVQGPRSQIATLKQSGELLVLDATADLPHTKKAPLALAIMTLIILFTALHILPIAISALCGVLLMIGTGCLSWREASLALSAPVILVVAASLALGITLLETGGAHYLAEVFIAVTRNAPPAVMLSGLMLLLAILTNIVSNNAAAVIGTPIAMSVAQQLALPAEPFILAVLFGANLSYATPMAYKTNLLVMSAGGYSFSDFMRIGIPLIVIMWVSLSILLPMIYHI